VLAFRAKKAAQAHFFGLGYKDALEQMKKILFILTAVATAATQRNGKHASTMRSVIPSNTPCESEAHSIQRMGTAGRPEQCTAMAMPTVSSGRWTSYYKTGISFIPYRRCSTCSKPANFSGETGRAADDHAVRRSFEIAAVRVAFVAGKPVPAFQRVHPVPRCLPMPDGSVNQPRECH
jgi:hypothetical protein